MMSLGVCACVHTYIQNSDEKMKLPHIYSHLAMYVTYRHIYVCISYIHNRKHSRILINLDSTRYEAILLAAQHFRPAPKVPIRMPSKDHFQGIGSSRQPTSLSGVE